MDGPPPALRDLIDEICYSIGPRPSGRRAEGDAARLLRRKLIDWGIETHLESFRVAPASLHLSIALNLGAYLVAFALYFITPVASLGVLLLLVALALGQRLTGLSLADLVLPKRWSRNVVGRIAPRADRRQLLIFSGHHDSANAMPLLSWPRLYPVLVGLVGVLLGSTVVLAALSFWSAVGELPRWLELTLLAPCVTSAVFAVIVLLTTIRRDAVLGANDNLSALAVVWELGRRLAASPPEHTEVWLLSFGSEELGLKGSRHFVEEHRDELESAVVINLESLGQSGRLHALTGEVMAPTSHCEEVVELLEASAVETRCGLYRRWLLPGLTDAASFSRRGIAASTLIRFNDQGYLDAYHTSQDAPELILEQSLVETLSVCERLVELVDHQRWCIRAVAAPREPR